MKYIKNTLHKLLPLIFFIILFLFFANTNPFTLEPYLYVIPYTLLFFGAYFSSVAVLKSRYIKRGSSNKTNIASVLFGLYVVLLLALLSIGEMSLRDVVIMSLLFAGCVAYVFKIDILP
jgi:uncharacterized membrane protein